MNLLLKFIKVRKKIELDLVIIMFFLKRKLRLLLVGHKLRKKDGKNTKLILMLGLALMISSLSNRCIIISLPQGLRARL